MQASLQPVPQLGAFFKVVSLLKRAAVPEDMVDYILFLSISGGSYINETELIVDAEVSLTMHT